MSIRPIRRGTVTLVLGLVTLLVGATAAHATTTVITDTTGDATLCHTYSPVRDGSTCTSIGSDPTIDIVSVRVGATASSDFVAEVQVLDLDDPMTTGNKDTAYVFETWVNGSQDTVIALEASRHDDATVGYLAASGPGFERVVTAVAFDFAANTIRWELSLAQLNDVLADACPTCPALTTGSVMTPFQTRSSKLVQAHGLVSQSLVHQMDFASSAATYEIGD